MDKGFLMIVSQVIIFSTDPEGQCHYLREKIRKNAIKNGVAASAAMTN